MLPNTTTIAQLQTLLEQADTLHLSTRARERLSWFLHFASSGRSVSATCAHFGISRATFQRWLDRFDVENPHTLEERSHHPHTVRQSAVPQAVIEYIRAYRLDNPQMGKEKIADLLWTDHHVLLSASTVGRIIDRECLYFDGTPLHWKKRVRQNEQSTQSISPKAPVIQQVDVVLQTHESHLSDQIRIQSVEQSFFSRMKMKWKPLRAAIFVVSVMINIALLLAILEGIAWHRDAEATHAAPTPLPVVKTFLDSTVSDAR